MCAAAPAAAGARLPVVPSHYEVPKLKMTSRTFLRGHSADGALCAELPACFPCSLGCKTEGDRAPLIRADVLCFFTARRLFAMCFSFSKTGQNRASSFKGPEMPPKMCHDFLAPSRAPPKRELVEAINECAVPSVGKAGFPF